MHRSYPRKDCTVKEDCRTSFAAPGRQMIRTAIAFIAVFAICGRAHGQEIGSAQLGLRLAQSQCSECHRVEGLGRSPNANAPAFEQIANTGGITSAALIASLRTSHKTMPNIIIKDADVGDLVTYILSLRTGR